MSRLEIVFPGESLSVDPRSSGFAHGFGLFETIRLHGGRIELWAAHWQRLTASARALGICCPFAETDVLDALRTLAGNLPGEGTLKLSLLREGESSRLVVYSRPSRPPPEAIGLLVDGAPPVNEASPMAGHKTHNYLENLLALELAQERGCFDALRLDSKGRLAEGAISNIFFVRDAALHTPCLECGVLPGVIRAELVDAFEVAEGRYQVDDLYAADAVFLANASIGFKPVDFLLSGEKKIKLKSAEHGLCRQARRVLTARIENTAVSIEPAAEV